MCEAITMVLAQAKVNKTTARAASSVILDPSELDGFEDGDNSYEDDYRQEKVMEQTNMFVFNHTILLISYRSEKFLLDLVKKRSSS